jgi:SGNH hydrolase-like domain, acetyltransferase AlgX
MIKAKVIIALFALISLIPLIQSFSRVLPDSPLAENRHQVPAPEWHNSPTLRKYLMGWQDWFNDRYPGRNFLIRLKTQIDYSLFSYSDKVHVGKDGWLFYRSVLDVEEPRIEAVTDVQMSEIVARLSELRCWLSARGVRMVIVDNQLKDEFYPEMLPSSAPIRPRISQYAILRRRIGKETGALYIDSSEILHRLKADRPIFHRTDFHWNDPAAFVVAQAAVDRLAKELGPPYRGWHLTLEIEKKRFSGGEASFMPLFRPAAEEGLFVHQNWQDGDVENLFGQQHFEYIRRFRKPAPGLLPPVVVFGDSYFDGMMRAGFGDHFQVVYRARIYHQSLQEILANLPKDTSIFVLQFIETAVGYFSIPVDYKAIDRPAGSVPSTPTG